MTPPPHPENMIQLGKGIAALGGGGVLYVAEAATSSISAMPDWINSFGLPVAMLLAAIYGLVKMFQSLLAERNARIADRDAWIAEQKKESEAAAKAREQLIAATLDQTAAFKTLTREIKNAIEKK